MKIKITVMVLSLSVLSNTVFASAVVESRKAAASRHQPEETYDPTPTTSKNSIPEVPNSNQPYMPEISTSQNVESEISDENAVDLNQIWKEFETSSEKWRNIADFQPKHMTIARQIDLYKSKGIYIRNTPDHYVQAIDDMARQNPDILKNPFEVVLKFVAIIDYDFDNGVDKEELARKVLGEKLFESNKHRLGR